MVFPSYGISTYSLVHPGATPLGRRQQDNADESLHFERQDPSRRASHALYLHKMLTMPKARAGSDKSTKMTPLLSSVAGGHSGPITTVLVPSNAVRQPRIRWLRCGQWIPATRSTYSTAVRVVRRVIGACRNRMR